MTTDFSGSELVNIEIQLQNKEDVFLSKGLSKSYVKYNWQTKCSP